MLFTSIFSLLALAALSQASPIENNIEDRKTNKYSCTTTHSGTLRGAHHGKQFSFTKGGSLITYTGDQATNNVLEVEFQACTDSSGKTLTDSGSPEDSIGRLRLKGTNSCIGVTSKKKFGPWYPKTSTCNSKKLTDSQTWRYEKDAKPDETPLFWAGFFNFGAPVNLDGEVCRGGYKQVDDGKPLVTSHKQIIIDCAEDDFDVVRWFNLD